MTENKHSIIIQPDPTEDAQVAGFKSEHRPASVRNKWPASFWNAWPTSSEFPAEQIEGLPAKFAPPATPPSVIAEAIDWTAYATQAAWFENIPASVAHDGGHRAYYMPSEDRIRLPAQAEFRSAEGYFCTRAHETVHWTKHDRRLARDFAAKRFGDEGYAMEELTAELGAAFCMAEIGLAPAIREDHAPYIANWLKALKNDAKALLTAASKASDALEYLCQFQPVDETHDPEANFKDAA